MTIRVSTKRSGFVLSTVLTVSSLLGACSQSPSQQANAPQAVPVALQEISSGRVQSSSEFVGTLEAAEKVEVKPEIQGQIAQITVQPGDRVEQGTPIMTLRPDQTVPQLQGTLAALENSRSAREASVRQREVAQAQLATAQSDLELAQTNFDRAQYLVTEGAIGQFQYDQASNNLDAARNRLTTAQEQLKVAEVGIVQAEGNIQQAQAQVDAARVSVDFKQVLSPIAGVIGDLLVKNGDFVSTGQTVTTITQNTALDLRISVPSNNLPRLRTGLPVELIDPNTKQKIATGAVSFISPNVDTQAQSILIKARFANQNGQLKSGQFVQARVIWGEDSGILVPTTAVTRTGSQGFVFVITTGDPTVVPPQTIVEQRPVTLGDIQGEQYEILDGLQAGEQIAVSNILRLRNGSPVDPQS